MNHTVDPLRAFDVGLLMAALRWEPSLALARRIGTIGQEQSFTNGRFRRVPRDNPTMHFVTIDRARPDFRVFIDLLHGPDWNVDTDGDSQPVNSRTWTYLYVADRTGAEPPVTIVATDEDANVFQVECTSARLEELAALYLFVRSGSDMTGDRGRLNDDEISSLQAKYLKELARATDARWHRSSDQDPYPKAG